MQPTVFEGDNRMRVFQEEIFGPVVAVASFTDFDDAITTANDTLYGLGAGVWTRDTNTAYRAGRAIKAGRVWTNCYHAYPAHAAFGGYKESGIGRENHKMMLEHYQQTKNLLVSYSPKKLGFFSAAKGRLTRGFPWQAPFVAHVGPLGRITRLLPISPTAVPPLNSCSGAFPGQGPPRAPYAPLSGTHRRIDSSINVLAWLRASARNLA
ncbi:NAD/NADP-dependent betaine aldehyde dehydrogenase [Streptomyces microflavus]